MRAATTTSRTTYERALAEPRFRAAIAAAWAGPGDPLDALWWLDRPGDPSPSGAAAPGPAAAEARRALYRADPPAGALEAYREAEHRERAIRAATTAALLRVDPRRVPSPPPDDGPAVRPDGAAPRDEGLFVGRPEDLLAQRSGWPRTARLLALPRAAVFATETTPAIVCLFLLTDRLDLQCATAAASEYRTAGVVLAVEPDVAAWTGLQRVAWDPGGTLRWWLDPDAWTAP